MADSNHTTPTLSAADVSFLRDEENWHDGPMLSLAMCDRPAVDADSARRILFTNPDLIGPFADISDIPRYPGYFEAADEYAPWGAYLVVCHPECRVCPFGARSCFTTNWGPNELDLCMYPPQVGRVSGWHPADDIPGWVTTPVVGFFRVLVDLARHIHKRYPFRLASIHDEARMWYDERIRGIAIPKEVARAVGWTSLHRVAYVAILPFS